MSDSPDHQPQPTLHEESTTSTNDLVETPVEPSMSEADPVSQVESLNTHHEVTVEMSAEEPAVTNEVEEEDHYEREEEIVRLLLRVVSFLEVNGHGSHPVLATILADRILSRLGLDPTLRVGYLEKPDAPGVVIPYPWIETFLNGRKDVTDLCAFGDKSKHIFALGIAIGFGEKCLKCHYHRRVPEGFKVVGTDVGDPDTVPTVSALRREISNVDSFLAKSNPRIRELYENVLEKAHLD